MPAEYFLEINTKSGGKVKGETLSTVCPENIPVRKFTITITSPGGVNESGEVITSGRVQLGEGAEFEFYSSAASVALFHTVCTNDPIKNATLSCLKGGPGGVSAIYLQWRFLDARVVSFKMGGDETIGIPTDTLKIVYSGIEISYKKQNRKGEIQTSGNIDAYSASDNAMVKATLS